VRRRAQRRDPGAIDLAYNDPIDKENRHGNYWWLLVPSSALSNQQRADCDACVLVSIVSIRRRGQRYGQYVLCERRARG
jgi:hypothetical protein